MNDRQITVQILGDAASLERAAAKSSLSVRNLEGQITKSSRTSEKELGRMGRGALAGSGAFRGLGRSVAFASGAFIGAAGFVEVLKSCVGVVLKSQASIAQLDQAVTNAHASVAALTPVLEAHAAAARKLGFDDDQTREAEAKLVTAFGATKKSLGELKDAEDLARLAHEDLGTATRQLILLQEGNTRAAKQFGLALPDLTKKQWEAKAAADGLNLAQEKGKTLYDELLPRIHNQAQAFANSPAGKIAEFHAEIQHLQESIGTGLLPIVDKYLTKVDDWLAKGKNQKRVTDDVKKVVDELGTVLHDAKDATQQFLKFADPVAKDLGGWKKVIEGIIALKFATEILGWGGAFKKTAGNAGKLRTELGLLKTIGPIVVGVEILIHRRQVGDAIGNAVGGGTFGKIVSGFERNALGLLTGQTQVDAFNNIFGTGGTSKGPAGLTGLASNPAAGTGAFSGATAPGLGGVQWAGDHAGLNSGFKQKLGAAAAAAGASSINVTSGKRSAAHNAEVGGAPNSNHLTGHAADGTVTINGKAYPLGAAPLNYGAFGLRAGSTFNWGGGPDVYHVDDGTNVGRVDPGGYGPPLTSGSGGGGGGAPPKAHWKGATDATIITAKGTVAAMLKGLPTDLDPVEQNAVNHIEALKKKLVPHMTAAEYAAVEVELKRWGKKLHDEVTKNAKIAAQAAAEAKKTFDRALGLDTSHILRDFDRSFAAQMLAFDRETQRGLSQFAVAQTPQEKALADYIAQRASEQSAATKAQQQSDLAAAIATGDPVQIKAAQDAINQQLEDDQQVALQAAADASRTAQDAKTTADQQAYQDQRDAQKQAMQDINDDQRTALQNNLDDWTTWLDAKQKSYGAFLDWLRAHGIDTSGLVDPNTGIIGAPATGQATATTGGVAAGSYYGVGSPFNPTAKLAGGAIVTKPTVALIGEGREAEGVFPLSVLGGLLGGSSKPMTLILEMEGQKVAQKVVPYQEGVVRVKLR